MPGVLKPKCGWALVCAAWLTAHGQYSVEVHHHSCTLRADKSLGMSRPTASCCCRSREVLASLCCIVQCTLSAVGRETTSHAFGSDVALLPNTQSGAGRCYQADSLFVTCTLSFVSRLSAGGVGCCRQVGIRCWLACACFAQHALSSFGALHAAYRSACSIMAGRVLVAQYPVVAVIRCM